MTGFVFLVPAILLHKEIGVENYWEVLFMPIQYVSILYAISEKYVRKICLEEFQHYGASMRFVTNWLVIGTNDGNVVQELVCCFIKRP